uniref:C3H1-type domain-containing protein n=1 Tax=Romanomermis culicivorax TaxID=13658 RepID=A0A915KAH6_ROMCU
QSTESNGENIERDRLNFVVEDPIWQDQDYVLANYKTELCKKPPRLCRQGYACPFYHNSKDKRRCTVSIKYRSTPCPSVKRGDEWGEPESCESGESCAYCHTRTEQQFHPEIYKSTKCNDMQQHGYCPRGPFCAFAHSENELHVERQIKEMVVKKLSTPSSSVTPSTGSSPLVSILSNGKKTENSGGVTAVSPNGHHAACSPSRSSSISCAAFEQQQLQRKR